MAKRVARRPRRNKPQPVSGERRRHHQRALRRQMGAAVAAVLREAIEAALEAEVTALLGREKYARRASAPLEPAGARCSRCLQDWRARFVRAGHYARTLLLALADVTV